MNDIHDIREPIQIKLIDVRILALVAVTVFVVTMVIFGFLVLKRVTKKRQEKVKQVNFQKETLERLEELRKNAQRDTKTPIDEIYFHVSSVVRWYIGGVRIINGLSKTRHEVYIQLTKCFDEVLWQCYLVEFAGKSVTKEDALKTIDLAIKLVKTCN